MRWDNPQQKVILMRQHWSAWSRWLTRIIVWLRFSDAHVTTTKVSGKSLQLGCSKIRGKKRIWYSQFKWGGRPNRRGYVRNKWRTRYCSPVPIWHFAADMWWSPSIHEPSISSSVSIWWVWFSHRNPITSWNWHFKNKAILNHTPILRCANTSTS